MNFLNKLSIAAMLTSNIGSAFSTEPITISGKVPNDPHQKHPATEITAKDPVTGHVLETTNTNPDGTYTLSLQYVNVKPQNTALNKLYKNPFTEQTRIDYLSQENGIHRITVHNLLGQQVMNQEYMLTQNSITTIHIYCLDSNA